MASPGLCKIVLTVTQGPDPGKSFTFTEPDNFLLGRNSKGSNAHYRLSPQDTYVSRNHFLVEINPPGQFPYDFATPKGCGFLGLGKKQPPDPIAIILGDDKPIPIEKRRDDLPKVLTAIVNKAIQKEPSRRFETAKEFQKELSECVR